MPASRSIEELLNLPNSEQTPATISADEEKAVRALRAQPLKKRLFIVGKNELECTGYGTNFETGVKRIMGRFVDTGSDFTLWFKVEGE